MTAGDAGTLPPPTPTARSVPHLLGLGLAGLACLGGAAALVQAEHQGWGLLLGLFGLSLLLVAPMYREGPCPRCGRLQSALGPTRCPGCEDWFEMTGGRFVAIAPGHVARSPAFVLPLASFVPPTDVSWPWPGRCCVCGREGTRAFPVKLTAVTEDRGLTQQLSTWSVSIPHCAEHDDGVQWWQSPAQVAFRSYDYARAFQAANCGRVG